jgi:hypothetical protein
MAVVVILIMIAFVGGAALQQILRKVGAGAQTVAYFGEKGKITGRDVLGAQSDLAVLRMLMFHNLFHFGMGDLTSRLLAQLLFPDSRIASALSDEMKQAVMQGRLQINIKDIDVFFSQATGRSEYSWILLKAEARQAGCIMTNSQAKQLLRQIIPQLTQGQADAKQLVDFIIKNRSVPEREIFRIVADIWAILAYTKMITSGEDVTISQVKAAIGREGEKINAEFVKINASDFVAAQPEPTAKELDDQFEQYKNFSPGQITDQNPYGFGYKLPAMIAIEYLVLKLDDVRTLVTEPTANETEIFYQQNLDSPAYQPLFKYDELTDPNDPESKVQKTKSYAEIAGQIHRIMAQDKTNRQAEMILNEAIGLTEAGFAGINVDQADSAELGKLAGDYKEVAAKLTNKYKIKIYTGQTGMLSDADIVSDRYLGILSVEGQNKKVIPLSTAIFALDELGADGSGTFGVPRVKMWQNIGPAKDMFGSIISILRVIRAETASEPDNVNVSISKTGVVLVDEIEQAEKLYSIKDKVAEDIKLQKAMHSTKERAAELVKLVNQKGWTEALDQLNKPQSDTQTAPTVNLQLDKLSDQTRFSVMDIQTARAQSADSPVAATFIRSTIEQKELLDELYSLLPTGKTEAANLTSVFEFKPGACYYVVKNVSRTAVTRQDYLQKKSQVALMLDAARSESLLLIHLRPDNIFKRMNFTPAGTTGDSSPAENQQQPAGAS